MSPERGLEEGSETDDRPVIGSKNIIGPKTEDVSIRVTVDGSYGGVCLG